MIGIDLLTEIVGTMSLLMKTLPATEAKAQAAPMQRSDWSPYQDNGG